MNCEDAHNYCLTLPGAETTFPFDNTNLVMKVGGRMFALLPLDRAEWILVKCDPDKALELRDAYSDILPAWHMNKRHWNMMRLTTLPDTLLRQLMRHSYDLVVAKLPRSTRESIASL